MSPGGDTAVLPRIELYPGADLRYSQDMRTEEKPTGELTLYRSIFELAMVGAARLSAEGKIEWVNEAFSRVLGYTAEQAMRLSLAEIIHPEELGAVRARIGELSRGAMSVSNTDRRFRHKDGHYVWVNIAASVVRDEGQAPYIVGILQDISERKQREIAEREREALLRVMVEFGKIGIWELNLITMETVWSAEFRELLGFAPEVPASPAKFHEAVHPLDRDEMTRSNRDLMEKGKSDFPPFRVLLPDGTVRWLQNVGRVVRVGDKLIGAIVDITENRQIHELIESQRAKMATASKMSALGEMAGGLAHEINNPVAIIHGHADVLKQLSARKELDHVTLKRSAEVIAQTADRISKITRALRAFARDAERDPFERVPLLNVVQDTSEFCRQRMLSHGVRFTIEPIPASLELECRPVQISQVLLNLLNNAYDAVEAAEVKEVTIAAVDLGERLELRVTDTGRGIPPELQERVFQPFFTTKDVGRGTGLGLSVASGLVGSHHGRITFESSPAGTRFVVSLPKKQAR